MCNVFSCACYATSFGLAREFLVSRLVFFVNTPPWYICMKYFRVFMNDQFVFCMGCSFSRPLKIKYNLVSYLFVIYNRTREKKKTHLHTTSDINYIRYQQYCKIIWRPLFFLHKKLSMSFIWGILWTVWPLHRNWCVSRVFPIKK